MGLVMLWRKIRSASLIPILGLHPFEDGVSRTGKQGIRCNKPIVGFPALAQLLHASKCTGERNLLLLELDPEQLVGPVLD